MPDLPKENFFKSLLFVRSAINFPVVESSANPCIFCQVIEIIKKNYPGGGTARQHRNITVFIRKHARISVDKGDLYTLIGGFVIILVIAVIANPGALSKVPSLPFSSSPTVQATVVPTSQVTVMMTPVPTQIPKVNLTPRLPDKPYRIYYTSNPFTYPVVRLPEYMSSFGASDIPLREEISIPFAYIEESRGGLTQSFSVPYEVWVLNISVTSEQYPQYAMFRMVLCDAKGNVLDGAEIQYPGTLYRVVRAPGTGMYMIISTDSIDSFRISLETPLRFYEKVSPGT